jgi:hypothetical protein
VFSDAGVTPAVDGAAVQQWNDQSGNGYHLIQATAGNRPTFQNAGLNGKQTVKFLTANSTFMTVGSGAVAMGTGTTRFGICSHADDELDPNQQCKIPILRRKSLDRRLQRSRQCALVQSRGSFCCNTELSKRCGGPQVPVSFATTLQMGTIYDGANVTTWLNNSASASAAQTSAWSSPGTLVVGTDQAVAQTPNTAANSTFDGTVSEIVITNSALSLTDRAKLEAYFASRW